MATRHYHAPIETGAEHVYLRKSDADDCVDNVRERAARRDTEFTPEDVAGLKVRSCTDGTCIGEA